MASGSPVRHGGDEKVRTATDQNVLLKHVAFFDRNQRRHRLSMGDLWRFVPPKFEEIFSKHAHNHPIAFNSEEVMALLKANREPKDFLGWLAGFTEWKIFYVLCEDKNGLLQKETIKAVYDGSLFERVEKEKESAKKKCLID